MTQITKSTLVYNVYNLDRPVMIYIKTKDQKEAKGVMLVSPAFSGWRTSLLVIFSTMLIFGLGGNSVQFLVISPIFLQ